MEGISKRQYNGRKQAITSGNSFVEGDKYVNIKQSVLKNKKDMAVENEGAQKIESEKKIKKEIQRLKDENSILKKRVRALKLENERLQKN